MSRAITLCTSKLLAECSRTCWIFFLIDDELLNKIVDFIVVFMSSNDYKVVRDFENYIFYHELFKKFTNITEIWSILFVGCSFT